MQSASKYTSVSIPTKTYLRKFIHYKFGDAFFASGPHHIQKYLSNLLEKKVYNYHFTALNTQYNDKLVIFISVSTFHKLGFDIKQENVIEFNNYIEELFDEELYRFCQDYLKYHSVAQKAITDFASHYNIVLTARQKKSLLRESRIEDARNSFASKLGLIIEEDISAECLRKMEYRARKRREKRENNFSQPVPQVSKSTLALIF